MRSPTTLMTLKVSEEFYDILT